MTLRAVVLMLSAMAVAVPAAAQRRDRETPEPLPNVPYDGRFTFVRIRYSLPPEGFGFRNDLPWSHDYNRAERHFTKILSELSTVRARTDASNVLALDDPELFKYPVAYMCEPGFWQPSDAEILGLRNYLLKGGFLIFDDFVDNQWFNFEEQIRRVLPDARLVPLTPEHPIFDSFYHIASLDFRHPYWGQPAKFYGIFEQNDPSRRLMVIVNYDFDLAEYWEFSDTGMFPVDLSNDAYKLGVNYLMYAMTR
jgi:hypothetical protein